MDRKEQSNNIQTPTIKPTSRRPSSDRQHAASSASNATETTADLDRS